MKIGTLLLALSLVTAIPASAQLQVNLGAGATTTQGGTIRLNADGSVRSTATPQLEGMVRNALGVEIRSSADVITDDDLDAYEENILLVDMNVADADSSKNLVGVSYWHEGRFLGIFPVRVQSRTDARLGDEDTLTVITDMPWWSFLVFGLGNIQGDVQFALLSNDSFSANVLAREDANARARAIEAIVEAHAQVAANN